MSSYTSIPHQHSLTQEMHRKQKYEPYDTDCLQCILELKILIEGEEKYVFLVEPKETSKLNIAHHSHVDEVPMRNHCRDCKRNLLNYIYRDESFLISVKKNDTARFAASKLIQA